MYKEKDFILPKAFYKKLYKLATIVNNVLVQNDIQYFSEAGTLLGVLRHRGIINVDDDVDAKVWLKDWRKILQPKIKNQFKKLGYTVVKETGLSLIKVFPTNAKEGRANYGFPFLDIFAIKVDPKDSNKVVYAHKWARDLWKNDFLYLDEMYPLKYAKFGASETIIPNNAKKYLDRLFPGWKTEKRIYQSHVLGIELDKPLIIKGPFKPGKGPFRPAKDFDTTTKLIKANKCLLQRPDFV